HEVSVVDNLILGREENLAHLHAHPHFHFRRLELLDEKELDRVFADGRFDTVFHLAANSDIARSHRDPDVDRDNTFATTYAVLRAMKEHKVGQIVFASTSAVYGELRGALSEDSGPLQPLSLNGADKLASEGLISSFVANYALRAL